MKAFYILINDYTFTKKEQYRYSQICYKGILYTTMLVEQTTSALVVFMGAYLLLQH